MATLFIPEAAWRQQRLLGALACSIILHALAAHYWLRPPATVTVSLLPLQVRMGRPTLLPAPRSESVAPARRPLAAVATAPGSASPARIAAEVRTVPANDTAPVAAAAETSGPAPPTVDIEAAKAVARSLGRAPVPRTAPIPGEALPMTVETAVAKAARREAVIEGRDSQGNATARIGKTRCVARTGYRPHFMEGAPAVWECD